MLLLKVLRVQITHSVTIYIEHVEMQNWFLTVVVSFIVPVTKEELETRYKENFFLLENSQAEKQVVPRHHASSVLGGFEAQLDEALSNLVWDHDWYFCEQEFVPQISCSHS